MRTSGANAPAAGQLADGHVEQADRAARQQRPRKPRRAPVGVTGHPGHQHHGDQRRHDPGFRRRSREPLEREPDDHRHDGAHDARGRGHDPHPPDREPVVQRRRCRPRRTGRPPGTSRRRCPGAGPHPGRARSRARPPGRPAGWPRRPPAAGRDDSAGRRRSRRHPTSAPRRGRAGRRPCPARAPQADATSSPTWSSMAVGPGKLHDVIGQVVVPARRREVDHLEVGGQLAQQLQGAQAPARRRASRTGRRGRAAAAGRR